MGNAYNPRFVIAIEVSVLISIHYNRIFPISPSNFVAFYRVSNLTLKS